MGLEVVYDIARYAINTDTEALVERAQIVSDEGVLRWRDVDGAETPCVEDNVPAVIAAHSSLNEIRPDQITRITAVPAVLGELPFVLRPTGEWEDFEEAAWSEAARAHIDEDWRDNRPWDPYRVLYVNEVRWCTRHTSLDDRLLPDNLEGSLNPKWGELSLYESGTMASGESSSTLGALTPAAAIDTASLDGDLAEEYADYTILGLHRRDGSVDADARILADWLLGSPVPWYFYKDGNFVDPILFVQLFAEAATSDGSTSLECEELAAAAGHDLSYRDSGSGIPTAYFSLQLGVGREVIDAALDLIADREPEYRDIVTAARDPESPAAKARDARMEALYEPEEPEP